MLPRRTSGERTSLSFELRKEVSLQGAQLASRRPLTLLALSGASLVVFPEYFISVRSNFEPSSFLFRR